jgi:uncharacterized membrane protein YfcA|tara:strand:+ start:43 stop:756 length:714 start_codon:yes stop_codon:yes gene_type:complete
MSLEFIAFFTILSFLTSLLTSIFSLGGGLIMLVALAQFFPPAVLIPLHGSVQLTNNLSRVFVYRNFFQWNLIRNILFSTFFGAFLAINLFGSLSDNILLLFIAATILFLTWAPSNHSLFLALKNDLSCGFVSGFAGIFVGANGPLVTACLRTKNLQPEILIANHGAIMVFQHLIKIILFSSFFSFSILDYLVFLILMTISGYLGAVIAKRLIIKISLSKFDLVLKVLLTLLSLFLIV